MVQTIGDRCLIDFYFLASNFFYLNFYIKIQIFQDSSTNILSAYGQEFEDL